MKLKLPHLPLDQFAAMFLKSLDPETAHDVLKFTARKLPAFVWKKVFPKVKQKPFKIFKTILSSRIGLAAGYDKTAELLPFIAAAGFGFVELGSVTRYPCLGQPRPRILRLKKDHSLINWMGLPNPGVDQFLENLSKHKKNRFPFAINIAKTPDFVFERLGIQAVSGIDDITQTYTKVGDRGFYTVINLSCPNTGEAKTFEDAKLFRTLALSLQKIRKANKFKTPLLYKISPDLESKNLEALIDTALAEGADGFVAFNTTRQRPLLAEDYPETVRSRGGLSGYGLSNIAQKKFEFLRKIVPQNKTLIRVGGLMSAEECREAIESGADLVQVYTGFVYHGTKILM